MLLESVCIEYIRQFFLRDLYDLEWLEHRVQDVSKLVYMLQLDSMLHLNQLLNYVFLVLSFSKIYEVDRVLLRQPIHQKPAEILKERSKSSTNTFFCIFK